jgi:hypothetical protein
MAVTVHKGPYARIQDNLSSLQSGKVQKVELTDENPAAV